ncbi:hypothetical protein [Streptomyces sp. NPDC053048]|uniref:hypothetical protein n=1 Tax=Streptomyces sp. NPDC053048 TaxID=3365694 RepID=UPI0037D2D97D
MIKGLRGGFRADREFGFRLADRFPELDITQADEEGVALIIHIDNPRNLNLFQLSRVLIGAASGGLTTAVVIQENGPSRILPLCNLWLMVDENTELKEQFRLESAIRAAA